MDALTINDIRAAADRIGKYINNAPMLEAPLLNEALGFRLFIKAENLQPTGSFKVRGAFNQLLQVNHPQSNMGVFAMSAGNHAQAVAYAAKKFGISATILMPSDAPQMKRDNTQKYGAKIIAYNRRTEDREAIGQHIAQERGLQVIHPYNDPLTIAGQGTIGLEIHKWSFDKGIPVDAILVNCSGGGMAAGIAIAGDFYDRSPRLFTAEPAEFNDMQRSLLTGTLVMNDRQSGTICDALTAPMPGENPFGILRSRLCQGLTATEDEVKAAMGLAAEHFKLVLEPGGAVALACACLQLEAFQGKNVVVVASGGNVDLDQHASYLREGAPFKRQLLGLSPS